VTILDADEENSTVTFAVMNHYDDLSADEPYELNFTITDDNGVVDEDESVTAEFDVAEPELEVGRQCREPRKH